MGAISEAVRLRPEAVRTLDCSHSTASIGAAADFLAEGALRCFTPCGRDTAWGKLVAMDAQCLFLGTTWSTCTLLHGCEEYGYAPYCFMDGPSRLEVVDHDGRSHWQVQKVHCPGAARVFQRVGPEMAERGLLRQTTIGAASVAATRARDLVDVGTRLVLEAPACLVSDRGFLERCRDYQRGLVPG